MRLLLVSVAIALVMLLVRTLGLEGIVAEIPARYGPAVQQFVGVAMWVAFAFFADRLFRFLYWDGWLRRKRNQDTPALIEDIVTIALLVLGISLGLYFEAGLSLTGLLTASGATAIVLGIALQAVIQDLFSGLSVNFDGSYAIGDWLTIYSDQMPEPQYGRVAGITWRMTYLRLEDGRRLILPNHIMTSNPVLNHSRPMGGKRLNVTIAVDNRFPSERATSILHAEALRAVRQKGLLRVPEPDVILTKVTGDTSFFEVRFFANPDEIEPNRAQSAVLTALHGAMLRHKVATPVTNLEIQQTPDSFDFGQREMRAALNRVGLFMNVLDKEQLDQLATGCKTIAMPPGALLIRQGENASSMFVILEGAARISVRNPAGENHEVAVVAGGDVVGEMSLMTGAPRTATVTAATGLRVLEITKEPIEALMKAAPELLERFGRVLAQRQLELNALTDQPQHKDAVEKDLLQRMRVFFGRVFRTAQTGS